MSAKNDPPPDFSAGLAHRHYIARGFLWKQRVNAFTIQQKLPHQTNHRQNGKQQRNHRQRSAVHHAAKSEPVKQNGEHSHHTGRRDPTHKGVGVHIKILYLHIVRPLLQLTGQKRLCFALTMGAGCPLLKIGAHIANTVYYIISRAVRGTGSQSHTLFLQVRTCFYYTT